MACNSLCHQPDTTLVLAKGSSCGINSHDTDVLLFALLFTRLLLIWGFSSFQTYKSIYKV